MNASDQSFITLVQQSRYLVAALALAVLWTVEAIAPMFVGREHRLSHIAANFGLAAINVHHSRWQPETDSNYSSFLSVWDRIFGSFRLREKPQEIALGLDGWHRHEWRQLPGMLAAPFRKSPASHRSPPIIPGPSQKFAK